MHFQTASYPPPPSWAEGFRSDDLDLVRAFVSRSDGEHSRVAHRAAPLGYELARLDGEQAKVGWVRVAVETTIRGAVQGPVLHLAPPAGTVYRMGRREVFADPQIAVFAARGWEFTRRSPAGSMSALALDETALLQEIALRHPDAQDRLLLTSRPIGIEASAQARLASALSGFVQAKAPGADAAIGPHAEVALLSAVADLLVAQSAVASTRAPATARFAEVEQWIEAHLETPITTGQLCRVAGVGQRALEKIFESRRGMSPMRFVVERRLAAAHRLLDRADNNRDVTDVAHGLGFAHVGRFAALYRQAYGELPSQTAKRARRIGCRAA